MYLIADLYACDRRDHLWVMLPVSSPFHRPITVADIISLLTAHHPLPTTHCSVLAAHY